MKMNEDMLKDLIVRFPFTSAAQLSREFNMDHSSIFYWVRKLRKRGVKMEKLKGYQSDADYIIEKVIAENPHFIGK